MADWKKNRQKFQMPHDRVERCMRYVKAVEKAKRKAEKAKGPQRDRSLRKERPSSRRCCSNGGRQDRRTGRTAMLVFSGLEIKPYSQLTELPRVRIDRVRVEVQRTLFGEVEYHLVGTYGDEGKAWPVCAPLTELPDVWERKKEIESAIFKARQEEQYARKRKDAGYLETPARPVCDTGD